MEEREKRNRKRAAEFLKELRKNNPNLALICKTVIDETGFYPSNPVVLEKLVNLYF